MKQHSHAVRQYLKIISEPNRLKILLLLKQGQLCVCQIYVHLELPQNLVSHHLKMLKNFGLLKSFKQGLKIIYSRNEAEIKKQQKLLGKIIL